MAATEPVTSVWLSERTTSSRRRSGPAEGLDLGRIVRTAVRMLDSEGLAKFSMRGLAAELGFTPMSVYWYVATKDDLLERALDEVQSEMVLPSDDLGWQEALLQLARTFRTVMVVHPWVSRLIGQYMNVGPHANAFSDSAMRAISKIGLPPERQAGALSALFQFVYGYGTIEGTWKERCRVLGISEDELHELLLGAVAERPEFAEARPIAETQRGLTATQVLDRDFEFALETVLAGIEAIRDRHAASEAP